MSDVLPVNGGGTLSKRFANDKACHAESAMPNGTDRLHYTNGKTDAGDKAAKLNGAVASISGGAASAMPAVKCTLLTLSQQAEASKKVGGVSEKS
jgi:hypothetical protein